MRKPRLKKPGSEYHLIARINRKEFIFVENEIKDMFLLFLRKAKSKYHFSVRTFCIMDNHVHLIIKPLGNTDLSRLMQWTLSKFAREFNKRKGYIGHVFYDRFKSIIIKDRSQLYTTILYIWNNAAVFTKNNIKEYKYSGYYHLQKNIFQVIDPPDPDTLYCLEIMYNQ